MKKVTSILLAGLTVLAMSGCDENDIIDATPEAIQSVDISDLTNGYKVSGTGDLSSHGGIDSITYCNEQCFVVWSEWGVQDYYPYTIDGNTISERDEIYADIDTDADGTPGRLEVGVTYNNTLYGGENSAWTVTGIEEVECTPNPT